MRPVNAMSLNKLLTSRKASSMYKICHFLLIYIIFKRSFLAFASSILTEDNNVLLKYCRSRTKKDPEERSLSAAV